MIRNYIITAWRNLVHSRVYSVIAIAGLALGLAISILVFWGVNDELTYDRSWPDANRIYRLNATIKLDENRFDTWVRTPAPIAALAKKDFPAVENAVRFNPAFRFIIKKGEEHLYEKNVAYTEPSFFELFHIHFLNGNAAQALKEINNIVLSRDAAIRYFGDVNKATGQTLIIGDKQEPYTVSAVMENMPVKSSVRFDVLLSMDVLRKKFRGNGDWKTIDEDWGNFNYFTFVKLKEGTNTADLARQLSEQHIRNNGHTKTGDVNYLFQPLNTLHLYGPSLSPDGIKVVNLFLLIGVLIILIAVINYVNLSTARATRRAREVGLRRVVGAGQAQLLVQFITEFILVFIAALIIALAILPALVPLYKSISGKTYQVDYWTASSLRIIGWVALATILLASVYPAWLLSSFNPTQVLKSGFNKISKGGWLRKSLVVLQFSFSIILIICTMVVGKQLNYIQTKELGFDRENIFTVELNDKMGKQLNAIISSLRSSAPVADISFASDNILEVGSSTDNIKWPGKKENSPAHISPMEATASFTSLMNMQFAAGSGFTGTPADSAYYLINESAAKLMGLKDPVGTVIELWDNPGEIKGVLKDYNNGSMKTKIEPSIIRIADPQWGGILYVKAKAGMTRDAVTAAGITYRAYNDIQPYEYKFLDDEFDAMYRREAQTGALFKFFAAIAVLLSCLGLFGLAVFTAERRKKEIGIRKVMGASVQHVTYLLSKEFTWLVLLANIIAWPVAWFAMHKWIQSFVYRTSISWWIFFLAGAAALLLALFTTGFQAIRAAVMNPVKSLRTE